MVRMRMTALLQANALLKRRPEGFCPSCRRAAPGSGRREGSNKQRIGCIGVQKEAQENGGIPMFLACEKRWDRSQSTRQTFRHGSRRKAMNKLILSTACAAAALGLAACDYNEAEYNEQNAIYNAEEANYTDNAAGYDNMADMNMDNAMDNAAGNATGNAAENATGNEAIDNRADY
jgi:hypothetical protein